MLELQTVKWGGGGGRSEQFDDNFYDSISNQLKLTYEINIIHAETPGLMNDGFSKIEVARAINLAKTGKAQGTDMIPNEVLQNITMKEFFISSSIYVF